MSRSGTREPVTDRPRRTGSLANSSQRDHRPTTVGSAGSTRRRHTPPSKRPGRSGDPRRRLIAFLVIMAVMFLALTARLAELQAINPDARLDLEGAQTIRTETIAADRGSIFDRNGYEMALSIPRRTVFADPKFVSDPAGQAAELAPILGLDPQDVTETLTADNRFGFIARQVTDEVAAEVEALELDGIYLLDEPTRFTPADDVAEAMIGLTNIDNVGLGGLELQYDDVLTGTPGEVTVEQDPSGRTIPSGEASFEPPIPGDGIVLTIDTALQYETERVLLEHVASNEAEGAMAVLMEPDTGEILSIVNVETDPETGEPRLSTNNLAVTTVFEPGSVMKIVGMSGAIEDGLLTTSDCVNAPSSMEVGGATFSEFSPTGGGCYPLEDVIIKSSNTGSINIARTLGEQRMYDYFKAFGLGEPTNLGFPNELSGFVRPVEDWWGSSIAGMPIGQGISVTPVQMLLAYNTIANDGTFVPAQLVRATVDGDGVEHLIPKGSERQVVSVETAQTVRGMLTEVVSRGTGKKAQVEGYYPGGKTGTAQIPAPDGGYTFPDGTRHYMATFVGMIPAADPQLTMIIVTQQPTAGPYTGGAVSGPVFAKLADFAVKYLQIPPSGVELAPEDLGPARPSDDEPVEYYSFGEPPEGRVRATPATVPAAPGDDETESGAG